MSRVRTSLVVTALALGMGAAACVPPQSTTGQNASKPQSPTAPTPKYLFDDEFNGTNLDTTKWQPNWLGGSNNTITKPINDAEQSCYDPSQVSVSDGYLHLDAARRFCKANNGTTYGYASGLVNTNGRFTFKDGHLEARVWLPGNASIQNWPAVWTDGTGTWPNTGESDIMEGLSGKACYHYHSPSGGPGGCAPGTFTGWHTFGEDVRGNTTTYLYDGNVVGTEKNVEAPHYIILNLGVGGYGGTVAAPAQMIVDYVRVTP